MELAAKFGGTCYMYDVILIAMTAKKGSHSCRLHFLRVVWMCNEPFFKNVFDKLTWIYPHLNSFFCRILMLAIKHFSRQLPQMVTSRIFILSVLLIWVFCSPCEVVFYTSSLSAPCVAVSLNNHTSMWLLLVWLVSTGCHGTTSVWDVYSQFSLFKGLVLYYLCDTDWTA